MVDSGAVQRGTPTLAPIGDADLADVGSFLHEHLNHRVSADAWAASILPTWWVDAPNRGFLLRDAGRIVGVQLAFYSDRDIAGRLERFCNLGAWCVLEDYRSQGVRLLRAVLAQPGYTFTDLSPSGNVVRINRLLSFESLDTTTALVPHVPPLRSRGARVISDPDAIGALLEGPDLRIFWDHKGAAAAIHLVLVRREEHCYVVLRRDRRKGLPVFASMLHCSNPGLLRGHLGIVGRHLLFRHGLVGTMIELRLYGNRPAMSFLLRSPRPKMFRSAELSGLSGRAIDNLYSELELVAW